MRLETEQDAALPVRDVEGARGRRGEAVRACEIHALGGALSRKPWIAAVEGRNRDDAVGGHLPHQALAVGEIEVARGVHGHAVDRSERRGGGGDAVGIEHRPAACDGRDDSARRDLAHTEVTAVGDVQVARSIDRQSPGIPELRFGGWAAVAREAVRAVAGHGPDGAARRDGSDIQAVRQQQSAIRAKRQRAGTAETRLCSRPAVPRESEPGNSGYPGQHPRAIHAVHAPKRGAEVNIPGRVHRYTVHVAKRRTVTTEIAPDCPPAPATDASSKSAALRAISSILCAGFVSWKLDSP